MQSCNDTPSKRVLRALECFRVFQSWKALELLDHIEADYIYYWYKWLWHDIPHDVSWNTSNDAKRIVPDYYSETNRCGAPPWSLSAWARWHVLLVALVSGFWTARQRYCSVRAWLKNRRIKTTLQKRIVQLRRAGMRATQTLLFVPLYKYMQPQKNKRELWLRHLINHATSAAFALAWRSFGLRRYFAISRHDYLMYECLYYVCIRLLAVLHFDSYGVRCTYVFLRKQGFVLLNSLAHVPLCEFSGGLAEANSRCAFVTWYSRILSIISHARLG